MLRSITAISAIGLTLSPPAIAQEIGRNQREITTYISPSQGHLVDWSNSGLSIERIFVDNPESFRESFVFVTDGCTKEKCSAATTMLNLGARGQISRIRRGSLKVVLRDRRGKKSVAVIKVVAVPWFVTESITTIR